MDPDISITDFAKFENPGQSHIYFQAIHEFLRINKRLPKPCNKVTFYLYILYILIFVFLNY